MTVQTSRATNWSRALAPYKQSDTKRSLFEILVTLGPLFALWGLGWAAATAGLWPLALLLGAVAALFLVRTFMIQHDCGHGAFFPSRFANDWFGRALGVLTLTPYDYWRDTHSEHHATSGDLDRRGHGAVDTLTLEEYRALSPLKQFGYRLYRHPLVMFGIGPAYVFLLHHRVPVGRTRHGWKPWASTIGTTAVALAAYGVLVWLTGPAVLLVNLTSVVLGATIGVWLFYVQHQFDGVAWTRSDGWKPQEAALLSSSHYDLPAPLRWLTADIGVHHVHHLSSRIPYYRLPDVLRDHPELKPMSRLGFLESFGCAKLALWDEAAGRLISFREVNRAAA